MVQTLTTKLEMDNRSQRNQILKPQNDIGMIKLGTYRKRETTAYHIYLRYAANVRETRIFNELTTHFQW